MERDVGQVANVGRGRDSSRRQYRNVAASIDAKLALGERAVAFLRADRGDVIADTWLRGGDDRKLPYGFVRSFVEKEMGLQYMGARKMLVRRSIDQYCRSVRTGALTRFAMRDGRTGDSKRVSAPSRVNTASCALGHELLQHFVDELQMLRTRVDVTILMDKARELRAQMIVMGVPEASLPVLTDGAGKQWFRRWRKKYGIVYSKIGTQLKVKWGKVLRRVRVLLSNQFRLRALWEIVHPDTPMRWVSLDQKPSWFNNAGHTGSFAKKGIAPTVRENFAQTRERYTILTVVPLNCCVGDDVEGDGAKMPRIEVLFKAENGARIRAAVEKEFVMPHWMKMRFQVKGSYRSEDVCEALEWILPQAQSSEESIVVLLDWYSGHRSDEVMELVRRKGHVLLFHGGGTTPWTQVNDTHLHAMVQRLMVLLENRWALASLGSQRDKIPSLKRSSVLEIVTAMWQSIDHPKVAEKAYKQTGPTLPMSGPILQADVYKNLRGVFERLDPSDNVGEIGTKMRDEAIAFVKQGYDEGRWTTWADAADLIEEHDDEDEPLAEGLEAFQHAAEHDDDDGDGDDREDDASSAEFCYSSDGSDKSGDESSGGDGGDAGSAANCSGDDADAPLELAEPPSPREDDRAERDRELSVEQAREVMLFHAKRSCDDALYRRLLQGGRVAERNAREGASETALRLRKRAQEQWTADAKRRKTAQLEERRAADDSEKLKALTAKALADRSEARTLAMQQTIINRRDLAAQTRQAAMEHMRERWLQTEFPAAELLRVVDARDKLTVPEFAAFTNRVRGEITKGTFDKPLSIAAIPHLWEPDDKLTVMIQTMKAPGGGRGPRAVRSSAVFLDAARDADSVRAARVSHLPENNEPAQMLMRIFKRFFPLATTVFAGSRSPQHLIHMNDYVLEKAFIYGLLFVSRRMGSVYYPAGLHQAPSKKANWPPVMPRAYGGAPAALAIPIEDGLRAAPSEGRPAGHSWE